jgi:hypothetical protein
LKKTNKLCIRLVLLLILISSNSDLLAQLHHQMISTQGGVNKTQSGFIVSQTIGQTSVVGNYSNENLKLGLGFQQSTNSRFYITGINSETFATIFPNPFDNQITIGFNAQEIVSVTIFDMAGNLIYKNKLSFVSENKSIDVSYVSSGVYIVKLQSKSNISYTKIVKR